MVLVLPLFLKSGTDPPLLAPSVGNMALSEANAEANAR